MIDRSRTFTKALLIASLITGSLALPAQAQMSIAIPKAGAEKQCDSLNLVVRHLRTRHRFTNIMHVPEKDFGQVLAFTASKISTTGEVTNWGVRYDICTRAVVEQTPL